MRDVLFGSSERVSKSGESWEPEPDCKKGVISNPLSCESGVAGTCSDRIRSLLSDMLDDAIFDVSMVLYVTIDEHVSIKTPVIKYRVKRVLLGGECSERVMDADDSQDQEGRSNLIN